MAKLSEIFTGIESGDTDIEALIDWTGDSQWNAVFTICLGELVENGIFNWDDDLLKWDSAAYDAEQYSRVCTYFIERFRFREISIEPFWEWANILHRKLVYELMPKYKPLYERVAQGVNPYQETDEYRKRRTIGSEYPETLLSGNADYISDGEDEEEEVLREGNLVDAQERFAMAYHGVDELLLDELECMFYSMYTANVNGL